MSSHPIWNDPPGHLPEPARRAALYLVALAPADAPLPQAPQGCRWLTHDGIAGLACSGQPDADTFSRRLLWQLPGATPIDPQPVRIDLARLGRVFEEQSAALNRVLSRRAHCAEYRITVSGAAQPVDFRLFAKVAQDLAALSRELCATPTELVPNVAGDVVIALSLILHSDRIGRLVRVLDDARQLAEFRGLSLRVIGPDALRSFPLTLPEWAEAVPEHFQKMKRAG